MTIRGVIFDLDGTLLDTLEDIANPANETLRILGYPTHPVAAYRTMVGDGVEVLVQRMLPASAQDPEALAHALKIMRQQYPKYLDKDAKPYPGILELLEALKAKSLRLAVLSNKIHHLTQQCIETHFGSNVFSPVQGHGAEFPKKPQPDAAIAIASQWNIPCDEIAFIGDTSTDMQTATAAGMRAFGAEWGFRDRAELIEHGAIHVAPDATALIPLLTEQSSLV